RAGGRLDLSDDALELSGDPLEVGCLLGEDSGIGIHLCHRCLPFLFSCVLTTGKWRVLPPPRAGKSLVVTTYQSSSSSSAVSYGSRLGVCRPGREPPSFLLWPIIPGFPAPEPTGASPTVLGPAPAPTSGLGDVSVLPMRLAIIGVRAIVPPAPGTDAARTSPAPELAPEPPTNGWLDSGLAPMRPTCALSEPMLLNIEVIC